MGKSTSQRGCTGLRQLRVGQPFLPNWVEFQVYLVGSNTISGNDPNSIAVEMLQYEYSPRLAITEKLFDLSQA
jgi:hypothetical protein